MRMAKTILQTMVISILSAALFCGCQMQVSPAPGGVQVVDNRTSSTMDAPSSSAAAKSEASPAESGGTSTAGGPASTGQSTCPVVVILGPDSPAESFAGIYTVDAAFVLRQLDGSFLRDTLIWDDTLTPETASIVRTFSSAKLSQSEIISSLNNFVQDAGTSVKKYKIRIYAVADGNGNAIFYALSR